MLAHVPSFGRNPRGSPDFLAYPVPKACMHVLGTRVPRRLVALGTEAARAMQVTRPNEIRRPGVRLHPKACAALGLEAERARWKENDLDLPYYGPFVVTDVRPSSGKVRPSPRFGGESEVGLPFLKRYTLIDEYELDVEGFGRPNGG